MEEVIKNYIKEFYANDVDASVYEMIMQYCVSEVCQRLNCKEPQKLGQLLKDYHVESIQDLFDSIIAYAIAKNLSFTLRNNSGNEPLVAILESEANLFCDQFGFPAKIATVEQDDVTNHFGRK